MKRPSLRLWSIVVMAVVVVALGGAAAANAATRLEYRVLRPPGLALHDVRSIAVPAPRVLNDFDSPAFVSHGAAFATMIETGLAPWTRQRARGGVPFEVVRSRGLDPALPLPDNQAIDVARRLGVDAVLISSIRNTGDEERFKAWRLDRNGKGHRASCRRRSMESTVHVTVVRVADGATIGAREYRHESSSFDCADPFTLPSPDALVQYNLDEIAGRVCSQLSPSYHPVSHAFQRTPRKYRARVRAALDLAAEHRLADARSILQELVGLAPRNARLQYNLGLLAEADGDLVAAEHAFTRAGSLSHRRRYDAALKRIRRRGDELDILAGFGVGHGPVEPRGPRGS